MTSAVRFENILRKYYFLFRVFFLLYSTAVYTVTSTSTPYTLVIQTHHILFELYIWVPIYINILYI